MYYFRMLVFVRGSRGFGLWVIWWNEIRDFKRVGEILYKENEVEKELD